MYFTSDKGKLNAIYFPLTANPAGYHHLLLAECVLRQFPQTELIVFLLSNGLHPDPLKNQHIPQAAIRLQILRSALSDWSVPEKSIAAQIAEESGTKLKLQQTNSAVSNYELSYQRPLRLAEHIKNLSGTEKVAIIVGADLIERMLNPKIFTKSDLMTIAQSSHLLVAPRNDSKIEPMLELLKQRSEVALTTTLITPSVLPQKLHKYLLISSTLIRRAAQAGHSLNAFLPAGAAKYILLSSMYELQNKSFAEPEPQLNEFELRCFELKKELNKAVKKLQKLLDQRAAKKLPHRFAVVETSTGGQITVELTSSSGASEHFLEGRILYCNEVQKQFLRQSSPDISSVSKQHAEKLARQLLDSTTADWTLSETGMAGPPSAERRSQKNGQCHLVLALSPGVKYKYLELNPFFTRNEHQLLFAIEALKWAEKVLNNQQEITK
ncbi:MAG: CinA family protein [SAR324 cluster bacterium]|nr:CinA family protein [SAR324 cluster bacterium]MBL7035145.1 CinA family protein [SAR324 cluster bacterium]